MSVIAEMEVEAGENANRALTLIEGERPDEFKQFVATLTPDDVVFALYAVGQQLLRQEAVNETLAQSIKNMAAKNQTLEAANVSLFAERRKLTEMVASMREDRENQAGMIARL